MTKLYKAINDTTSFYNSLNEGVQKCAYLIENLSRAQQAAYINQGCNGTIEQFIINSHKGAKK